MGMLRTVVQPMSAAIPATLAYNIFCDLHATRLQVTASTSGGTPPVQCPKCAQACTGRQLANKRAHVVQSALAGTGNLPCEATRSYLKLQGQARPVSYACFSPLGINFPPGRVPLSDYCGPCTGSMINVLTPVPCGHCQGGPQCRSALGVFTPGCPSPG